MSHKSLFSSQVVQEELLKVPIDSIEVNPFQPRKEFNPDELEDLAASIQAVGIIHPPLVRPLGKGCYELIAGERRLRAAKLAGLEMVPVVVRHTSAGLSAQAALIENLQRVDLDPIEVAQALQRLIQEFGLSQTAVAKQVGKKRSTVANYLRLLTLPTEIQRSLSSGAITMGHAKVILSLESRAKQGLLHEVMVKEQLTVRQSEERVRALSRKARHPSFPQWERDPHLQEVERRLQAALGTKVMVSGSVSKGKITVDYYSLDDLERVLARLQWMD